jgi:hypothetical protein
VEQLDVEFVCSDEDAAELERLLRESGATGVEPVEEAGILPVIGIVVAAALAVSALANVVIKLRRAWRCGVVVDARVGIIRTEKNCDLPPGTVLVFTRDGERHTLHEPSPVDLEQLLSVA